MGFGFSNPTSACSDSVSVFLLDHLIPLPLLVGFLFMFEFSHDLLVHPSRPSTAFAWLPARGDGPILLWQSWKINQLSYIPHLSSIITHGILPSPSLNRPKAVLLKLRVVILLFALFQPLTNLNFIIPWSLQQRLPPAFTTLTYSSMFARSSRVSLLFCFLIFRKLSSMHSRNLLDCLSHAVLSLQQIHR